MIFCNLSFFDKAYSIVQSVEDISTIFVISIPFAFAAIINVLLLPLSFRATIKPIFAVIITISAAVNFVSYRYGIIFDDNMFRNIIQTDSGEAASFVTTSAIFTITLSAAIPVLILIFLNVKKKSFRREMGYKFLSLALSLCVIGIIVFTQFEHYAAIGRNNKTITRQLIPIYPLKMAYKFVRKEYFTPVKPYRYIALDAARHTPEKSRKKLVLLVLGETQRSMNYSLNGYERETNVYTKDLDVISFQNVTSYGTATAISVPYIFSMASHAYGDSIDEKSRDNVIDVVARAGVFVSWHDNDSGCKGGCRNVNYTDMRKKYAADKTLCNSSSCYDALFENEMKEIIQTLPDQDSLIVFHTMGSHGPSYWQRYPEAFRRFTPDCPKSDIQNCTTQELVNTYDNTILYSDYVLANLLQSLKETEATRDISVVFLSDHGESLGENGLYLHGMPRAIAPKEQTHVPFIVWLGKNSDLNSDCLKQKAKFTPVEKINLADTLIGLMGVSTSVYSAEKDIFNTCRTAHKK